MFSSLKKMFEKNGKPISVVAPADGTVIPMSEVNDQTFAEEMLGPGVAICPQNGTIKAPIDGTIAMLFDTLHAVCIQGEGGLEIIVHVGLDTVELNGKHYTAHIKNGDKVQAGDVLLDIDLPSITQAGYDVTTPVVITNLGDYKIEQCFTNQKVKAGDEVIKLIKS